MKPTLEVHARRPGWFASGEFGIVLACALLVGNQGGLATEHAGAAGAAEHWAFQRVTTPPLPVRVTGQPPDAQPIDRFIDARLAEANLGSAPPADRRTLIRRVTFGLTGLPPSADEVAAFVSDDRPQAYHELVDRLLASPHYGAQWARHWLDVARYSDTKGYVYAREQRNWAHAWVYRDWVVRALNDDMPYDRFLLLQIAADQVEPRESSALAAMGFLTIGRRFLGVTHDIIDDRIDVVTRGTMALTVACARCHDHKYDPIPTADYYSLYGVFENGSERLVSATPSHTAPGAIDAKFLEELSARQRKLSEAMADAREAAAARVRGRVADYLHAQFRLDEYPQDSFGQLRSKDDMIPASVRRWADHLDEAEARQDPVFVAWHTYTTIPEEEFADRAPEATRLLREMPPARLNPRVAELFVTPPKTHAEMVDRYAGLMSRIDRAWQEVLSTACDAGRPLPAGLPNPDAEAIRRTLYGPHAPCEVPDEAIVHVENFFDITTTEALWRSQSELEQLLIDSPAAPPFALALFDRKQLRQARVLERGNPAQPAQRVPRQFLQLLSGANRQPFQRGSGRLELATAIVAPENPLTARVIVNRVWQHHFGAGLVRTPGDFGLRAQPPSHPALLDWLASQFMQTGWSLKWLHRQILTSAAYGRSSSVPHDPPWLADAVRRDPENRLLWRMNVKRLAFEEMHDALLATTGELDRSIGGKPQPLLTAAFRRRALYGRIDRQFLPSTLRLFDFASPDLPVTKRSQTTVPQQALFFLNDEQVVARCRALIGSAQTDGWEGKSETARVEWLYQRLYQRPATSDQVAAALDLVRSIDQPRAPESQDTRADWQYGYAEYDAGQQQTVGFERLPAYVKEAWQGGEAWPDPQLGWVRLTRAGGHVGNDHQHAAVRRWVAPRSVTIAIASELTHETDEGDGVLGYLVSSRQGLLQSALAHNATAELNAAELTLEAGDTIDFVADMSGNFLHDSFLWKIEIHAQNEPAADRHWDARQDFAAAPDRHLGPWEQLAHVLFCSNEFLFVD